MAAAPTATNERWVCLRCFASNDGSAATCSNCGLERGVDPAAGASGDGAVGAPAIPQASQGGGFPWRWVIYGVIALVVVGGSVLFAARRDDTGAISDAGDMSVFDLTVGDCFDVSVRRHRGRDRPRHPVRRAAYLRAVLGGRLPE